MSLCLTWAPVLLNSCFMWSLEELDKGRKEDGPLGGRAPGWGCTHGFCLSEASSAELQDPTSSQACEMLLRPSTGKGPPHGFWAQN